MFPGPCPLFPRPAIRFPTLAICFPGPCPPFPFFALSWSPPAVIASVGHPHHHFGGAEAGSRPRFPSVAQLGGAEACFRPRLSFGEQDGGAEVCFRPRVMFGGTFRDREIGFSARSATKLSSGGRVPISCRSMYQSSTMLLAQVRKNARGLHRYILLIF